MGSFYVSHAARHVSRDQVRKALHAAGRAAFVSPTVDGWTFFYDSEADEQGDAVQEVAERLSRELDCIVLAVLNHDDDILMYSLYVHGEPRDAYNSCPGYFDDGDQTPQGGDAFELCAACGVPQKTKEVEAILRKEDYVFAAERHQDLARLLGIPEDYACTGYRYLQRGEVGGPKGIEPV